MEPTSKLSYHFVFVDYHILVFLLLHVNPLEILWFRFSEWI